MCTAPIPQVTVSELPLDPIESIARFTLYSDFIAESARLVVQALKNKANDPQELTPVHSLLRRMHLCPSSATLQSGDAVIETVLRAGRLHSHKLTSKITE